MREKLRATVSRITALCNKVGTQLWDFKEKTAHLINNRGCAYLRLGYLPEELIISIFNRLEKAKTDQSFFTLCSEALEKFKANKGMYDGLLYTLQQYICCAYFGPEKVSAKGYMWEIATAVFMHNSPKECSCGNLITLNGVLSHTESHSDHAAREFDIMTDNSLFELKCCAWRWDAHGPFKEERLRKNAKIKTQILNQKAIAQSHGAHYVLISRECLDKGWTQWFKEQNIEFMDPSIATCSVIKNIAQLYKDTSYIA